MILIKKSQTVKCRNILQHYTGLHERYQDLTGEEKNVVKDSLLKEQKYLCAYCMCRLKNIEDVKIEHIKPQSHHPEIGLDYRNMLAVCKGNEGRPYADQTCDTHKGNEEIKADPTDSFVIESIRYKKSGEICSSDEQIERDLNCVLNLNQAYLKQSRKDVITSLRNQLYSSGKRGKSIPALLHNLDRSYNDISSTEWLPYVGISRWYVEKKLREHGGR